MHEVRVTRADGSIVDYKVCTCKIGHDHDTIGSRKIDGRNPNAPEAF